MPPSSSTSSSPPGAEPGSAPLDADPAARAEHDDGAGAHDAAAAAGEPDGDDSSGDGDGGADSDGAGDDRDEGADDGDAFADADDEAGRVASRPGYPAEPAARSRPFGRVSLAPPFASLTARSACPAARCAHRRCRTGAVAARLDRIARRTAVVSSRWRCAPRSSGTSPRSPSPAAPAAGLDSASSRAPPRASPVQAAPRTGSGTVPCTNRRAAVSARARAPAERFPHFAPHRAVLRRPHRCGHRRLRLRQRAAHVCLRLRAHRPPLTRRGGFGRLRSPTPTSPSLLQRALPFPTARGRLWFSHPTHRWCTAHTAAHAATVALWPLTLGSPARPWRAGKSASDLRRTPETDRQLNALAADSARFGTPVPRVASLLRRRQTPPGLRNRATAAGHRRSCVRGITRLRRATAEHTVLMGPFDTIAPSEAHSLRTGQIPLAHPPLRHR